jgi:menaquinone-dependent protoporphyrinogen oxidase
MSNKILITYASRSGSTAGVAEVIGQTLAEKGAQIEVRPVEEVKDLKPYSAVVAGSAIREGKWLPEAVQFVQTHQAELAQKPFATFTVCMTMTIHNGEYQEGVEKWLEPLHAMVEPISSGYFAGVLDLKKVPTLYNRVMFRLSILMGVWKAGDHRNWDAIRDWSCDLSARLSAQNKQALSRERSPIRHVGVLRSSSSSSWASRL